MEKVLREIDKSMAKKNKVDAPPPYAEDVEFRVIADSVLALEKLDEAAQRRVVRYLASRYGATE